MHDRKNWTAVSEVVAALPGGQKTVDKWRAHPSYHIASNSKSARLERSDWLSRVVKITPGLMDERN